MREAFGTLRFEVEDLRKCLADLKELGVEPTANVPASMRGWQAALVMAPEGTPLLLSGAS